MVADNAVLWQRRRQRQGRIVLPVAVGDGPLHDGPDALLDPAHGFRPVMPVRQQEGQDVGRGDGVDAFMANPGQGIVPQGGAPLVGRLAPVPPAQGVYPDDFLGSL